MPVDRMRGPLQVQALIYLTHLDSSHMAPCRAVAAQQSIGELRAPCKERIVLQRVAQAGSWPKHSSCCFLSGSTGVFGEEGHGEVDPHEPEPLVLCHRLHQRCHAGAGPFLCTVNVDGWGRQASTFMRALASGWIDGWMDGWVD